MLTNDESKRQDGGPSATPEFKVQTEEADRDYMIDRGRGGEMVRWKASLEGRSRVFGYGKTEAEAVGDLFEYSRNFAENQAGRPGLEALQAACAPFLSDAETLDINGPAIGGNMFPKTKHS